MPQGEIWRNSQRRLKPVHSKDSEDQITLEPVQEY